MQDSPLTTGKRVPPEKLRRTIDPTVFQFETTAEVEPLRGTIGQERALEAIETGLEIGGSGFNIFCCGGVGTGRNSTVMAMVRRKAAEMPTPHDWCYVQDFRSADEPNAIELPAGMGRQLAADMEAFIRDCREHMPKAFEGKEYEKRKANAVQQLQQQRSELFEQLQEKARELDHSVQGTPAGLVSLPMVEGKPIASEEFEGLPAEVQESLREKSKQVETLVRETVSEGRRLEKQATQQTLDLDRRIALFAVGHLIQDLEEKYREFDSVLGYLREVQQDIIDNIEAFKTGEEPTAEVMGMPVPVEHVYEKYRVNVVVDNAKGSGAPIVDERNPNYPNLFGQLEYRAQFGGMVTDHTMIKGGAVHRANGGFLILQALDVLRHPFAWEGLKRVIRTRKLAIENSWSQDRAVPAATPRPEPIPLDVKVILVGGHGLHQLLYTADEDFRRLFKIKADFDVEMDLTPEHLEKYASFISARCAEGDCPPFEQEAVARLAEYGSRLADHQDRLSTRFLSIADMIAEAGHVACRTEAGRVTADHLREAIEARHRRSRMIQDKMQRMIAEGSLLIDTRDAVPGQANGLSVYDLGDYQFGKPTRITCVTSIGRAGVVNIERESELSGSIHDKGVLIMTGYLAGRFGQDKPLSLTASICFEQSYGMVDGDSASCAELYVLLSSLAEVPLRQDIAITGSVNQRGQVQPIGGVNEKIEGFFEICKHNGLTGTQGVMIPSRNSKDLMLTEEVIEAVQAEQFHVWAVDTVEEGIEILTGQPADALFGLVDRRLRHMATVLKSFAAPAQEENADEQHA